MKNKRILVCMLSLMLLASTKAYASEDDANFATRGKVVEMLMSSADDYNEGVKIEDIIKGDENGNLNLDMPVTRCEALVMLKRAFKEMPELKGENLRMAIKSENFTDIPEWAKEELADIFASGIVAGDGLGHFMPDANVTEEQMNLFIDRTFSIFGSNKKDDFYAAVNKENLETMQIETGKMLGGTIYDLRPKTDRELEVVINEMIKEGGAQGTKEQKVSDFYNSYMDIESRNKVGIEPIKKYIDKIDSAKNVQELIMSQNDIYNEIGVSPYLGFGLMEDLKNSDKYILTFGTLTPNKNVDFYQNGDEAKKQLYIEYITNYLKIMGEDEDSAKRNAEAYYNFEKELSAHKMTSVEERNIDNYYNIYTLDQIDEIFKTVDIKEVFENSGFKEDRIDVTEKRLMIKVSEIFNDSNLDVLKIAGKLNVIMGYAGVLSEDVNAIRQDYNNKYLGIEGKSTNEQLATSITTEVMETYIAEKYSEKYCTPEVKKGAEKMLKDIIEEYKKKIKNLSWMSDETKKKAIEKLNATKLKVAYPDTWKSDMDNVNILGKEEGKNNCFENIVSISKESKKLAIKRQYENIDKTKWELQPYVVNAGYSLTSNEIIFPAAFLQAPIYDANASYEENLGAAGMFMAHEITHAFDDQGAKFDKNGNANNWWTEDDKKAFDALCENMIKLYDNVEVAPGIAMNGALTLGENVADNGAVSCMIGILEGRKNPDYKKFFESFAKAFASVKSRETAEYLKNVDVHTADKLRVNRTIGNIDKFYEVYNVTQKDGMYIPKEKRVKIW